MRCTAPQQQLSSHINSFLFSKPAAGDQNTMNRLARAAAAAVVQNYCARLSLHSFVFSTDALGVLREQTREKTPARAALGPASAAAVRHHRRRRGRRVVALSARRTRGHEAIRMEVVGEDDPINMMNPADLVVVNNSSSANVVCQQQQQQQHQQHQQQQQQQSHYGTSVSGSSSANSAGSNNGSNAGGFLKQHNAPSGSNSSSSSSSSNNMRPSGQFGWRRVFMIYCNVSIGG
uniref:Uncharacterized protein n=1 Tax=Trichogramma kaykai TaxID=54128 RepID=A0ABD2WC17_9HYME